MSDFVEWTPKHHGHQPLHWTPDMLTSVDGKNFVRANGWAWIAGSTYYVPHEAVGMVREDVEPEPAANEADIFEFIQAAAAYLEDMAGRGDHAAKHLHVVAVGILAEQP